MRRPGLRHDRLDPLPQVEMAPLRQLCRLVNLLERTEAGEHVPGNPLNQAIYHPCDDDADPLLTPLGTQLVNLQLALKRLVNHPLALWDVDPLVIRRASELFQRETE